MTDNTSETLKDIKSLMERSSRFISLSGLAGVFSGVYALLGAAAAHWRVNQGPWAFREPESPFGLGQITEVDLDVTMFLLLDGLLVLFLSLATSFYLSSRKAKKNGQRLWNKHSKTLLFNLGVPLLTGGLFCVMLFANGLIGLIAPTTLIFYGLALMNGGKFTLEEISYLGISEIILGLISLLFLGHGLKFWAIGFGVLHIVYGILMYFRHDR